MAANAVDWPAIYAASPEAAAARARVEELVQHGRAAHPPLALAGTYAQSFGVQVGGWAGALASGAIEACL